MFDDISRRGLVLLGCGKMGSAMLAGWLERGLPAASVWVMDPNPSDWVKGLGLHLNAELPSDPAIVLVAVKPQMMGDGACRHWLALGNGTTLFLSVAAGTPIRAYEDVLGASTPIIRAMPNTPAAVGKGITALIGNAQTDAAQMALAEGLLSAVGQTVRLDDESQMDAVTGVSGSGPAYVFHLIETLAAAGVAQGSARGSGDAIGQGHRGRRRSPGGAGRRGPGAIADQCHQSERNNRGGPGDLDEAGNRVSGASEPGGRGGGGSVARTGELGMDVISFDDFLKVDVRVGQIVRAEPYPRGTCARAQALGRFRTGDRGEEKLCPDHQALCARGPCRAKR